MEKVHSQVAYNFHTDTAILRGVMNITKNCRTTWREGKQSDSPFQHKTVNLNMVLRSITLEDGTPIFMSTCPILIGSDAGNTFVSSKRKTEILEFRAKILHNPVAWLNGWMYEILQFHPSCIAILFKGCDPEEVLLSIDCDFDVDTMTVSNPFEDKADKFVRLGVEGGFTLDLSALKPDGEQEPAAVLGEPKLTDNEKSQSPPSKLQLQAQREAFAKRLRLKDDATFTSKNSDAVSRVTGATANTDGTASFCSTTTAEKNRDFRAQCLEKARLEAAQTAAAAAINNSKAKSGASPILQGPPASKESAAAVPKTSPTTANLPSASTDGRAPA
jgi:hypothetical protein